MKTSKQYLFKVLALVLAMGLLAGIAAQGTLARVMAAPNTAPAPAPAAATPLPEAACSLAGATRTCQLWAKTGTLTMPDGRIVTVWGFADSAAGAAQVPGPVIRANQGETLEVVLHNEISGQIVSLAFPGQGLVPDLTGVPAGGTATYTFDVSNAGTFLYEAGLTAGGARQVAMGLAGALVVNDPAPGWDQDVVLVFHEIDFNFNLNPTGFSMYRFQPRYWLINGQAYPQTGAINVAAGSSLLLRYVNIGVGHRSIGLLGLDQSMLAVDGEASPFPVGVVAQPVAPGQAVDALVQIPAGAVVDTLYPLYDASLSQHNNNQRLSDTRAAFGGMLAFLSVETGAPPAFGPVASNVTVTPPSTDGTVDVILSATFTDDDSNVVAYEYFIDAAGLPGTGVGGAVPVPAVSVTVDVTIPAATIAALTPGDHTLYIRGQDALGNWGAPGSAVLTYAPVGADLVGPEVSNTAVSPTPTDGTVDVTVTATADETNTGGGLIAAAQYRLDGGAWQPMTLATPNEITTGLSATLPAASVAGLSVGDHLVEVQAQDDSGNWGAVGSTILTFSPPPPDLTGPEVTNTAASPNPADGTVDVTVTATADETNTGAGVVAAAQYRLDGGAWQPMTLAAPNEITTGLSATLPAASVAGLSVGDHLVEVQAQDDSGNWGAAGSTILTRIAPPDVQGPFISSLLISPNPVRFRRDFAIYATAEDVGQVSNIAGAEWFYGADPGVGNATAMTPSDGSFDSPVEAVTATSRFNTRGTYRIYVRARDAAGNWGATRAIDLVVR